MKAGLRRVPKDPRHLDGTFLDIWKLDWVSASDAPAPKGYEGTARSAPRKEHDTSEAPDTMTVELPETLEWEDPGGTVRYAAATPAIYKALFRDGMVVLDADRRAAAARPGNRLKLDEIDNYDHAMNSMVLKGMLGAVEWAQEMEEQLLRRDANRKIWVGWKRRAGLPASWDPVIHETAPWPLVPLSSLSLFAPADRYSRSDFVKPVLMGPDESRSDLLPEWMRSRSTLRRVVQERPGAVRTASVSSDASECELPQRIEDDRAVFALSPQSDGGTERFVRSAISSRELTWDLERGRTGYDDVAFPELGCIAVSVPDDFDVSTFRCPTPEERGRPFMDWFGAVVMPVHRRASKARRDRLMKSPSGKMLKSSLDPSDASFAYWLDLAAGDGGDRMVPPVVMDRYLLMDRRERSDNPNHTLEYLRPLKNRNVESYSDETSIVYGYKLSGEPQGTMMTDREDVLGGRDGFCRREAHAIDQTKGMKTGSPGHVLARRRIMIEKIARGEVGGTVRAADRIPVL